MQVKSLCSPEVVTVDAHSTVTEAAMLMRDTHVGALVVTQQTEAGERVCGIVTDRDLVTRVLADPDAVTRGPLSHWSERPLVVLHENDSVDEAVEAMKSHGVRRLLVRDANDRLAGILSIDDVVMLMAEQLSGLAGAIHAGLDREEARAIASAPGRGDAMTFPCFSTGSWTSAVGRQERS